MIAALVGFGILVFAGVLGYALNEVDNYYNDNYNEPNRFLVREKK